MLGRESEGEVPMHNVGVALGQVLFFSSRRHCVLLLSLQLFVATDLAALPCCRLDL
jgi:hypothetical protein